MKKYVVFSWSLSDHGTSKNEYEAEKTHSQHRIPRTTLADKHNEPSAAKSLKAIIHSPPPPNPDKVTRITKQPQITQF